ncbi:hypothetical protein FOZ60_011496 [Perkinsus olseni]|uniref:Alcohol dehydrogenase-like N-terminal domain-containing protein n=1 Tax=Perkinsus olseni TaxID=32597 RepID=A0A7J6PBC8_PEROL|nr:hypothetical protein FOZ60_011496 [Perkinsus olseni]
MSSSTVPAKTTMMGAVIHCDRRGAPESERHRRPVSCVGAQGRSAHTGLIKVLRGGICGTDIHMLKGYVDDAVAVDGKSPLVLGHEFVGIDTKTNRRVVAGINIPCGRCRLCRQAAASAGDEDLLVRRRNHCPHRHCIGIHQWSGCHTEYLLAPSRNLFNVPESLTDLEACCTEPLAAALRIVEQGIVKAGDRVCVIGGGRLGLMVADVLMRLPLAQRVTNKAAEEGRPLKQLCVIGTDVDRMRQVLGLPLEGPAATDRSCYRALVNSPDGASQLEVKLVSRYSPECATVGGSDDDDEPQLFDVVVECTGSSSYAAALNNALNLCRKMGTIVMKTTASAEEKPSSDQSLSVGSLMTRCVVDEMKLTGSRCGPMGAGLRFIEEAKKESPNDIPAQPSLTPCPKCGSSVMSSLACPPPLCLDRHIGAVVPLSEAVKAYTLAAVHHTKEMLDGGCAVATGRIITIRHAVVGGYQDDSHHLQWRLPSVSAREISQACNSAGVAYISERFSALGRRMILGFRFDPTAAVYEVEVRATTTTMDAMRRRLQRSRGEPSTDPFTTPRKSSTIPRELPYPFPFYTVTIAWKGAIEDATQVQGDEGDAATSTTSASSSASGPRQLGHPICDDRRPGLCKHGALAARVLLTDRDGPAPARGGAQQTMGEASPCSECKTPETQDRQVSSTTGKPDPFMNQGDITTVDDGTRAQYGRVALEAWSSDLPGVRLCQVKVGDDAICSLLVKMPSDGQSVNLLMSVCSACSAPTESHRGPRDQCVHVRAAIALLNEKHGRDQQGQVVADMPRPVPSIVGDAHGERRHTLRSTARPTDNIARRLVFTGPSQESKEAIPDNVLDPKRSVPLVVIDDAEPPRTERFTHSGLPR